MVFGFVAIVGVVALFLLGLDIFIIRPFEGYRKTRWYDRFM